MKKQNDIIAQDTQTFLNISNTNFLKGIFALMVVMTHIHARISLFSDSFIGTLLSPLGYLAVSGFFFLSAYGLHESFLKKKDSYMKSFLFSKVLPFYCICLTLILIYTVRDVVFNFDIDLKTILMSPFWGETVVDFGWYLQVQMFLYLLFYFVFKYVPKYKNIVILFCVLIYVIVLYAIGMDSTWYISVISFPMGLFVSQYKNNIGKHIGKNFLTIIIALALCVIFVITMLFGNKTWFPYPVRIAFKIISALLFALASIIACRIINFRFNPIEALGKRSLEIYIMQGLILKLWLWIPLNNDYLYIVLCVLSILTVSFLLHPIIGKLYNCFKTKPKLKG